MTNTWDSNFEWIAGHLLWSKISLNECMLENYNNFNYLIGLLGPLAMELSLALDEIMGYRPQEPLSAATCTEIWIVMRGSVR